MGARGALGREAEHPGAQGRQGPVLFWHGWYGLVEGVEVGDHLVVGPLVPLPRLFDGVGMAGAETEEEP